MSQTDELSPEEIAEAAGSDKTPLKLDVKVEVKSACERHVTVTVSEEDINRYFQKQFDDLMPEASVPGFRKGRAPRKLVEKRYRETVGDQVKGSLLLDSITQVTDDQEFSAISEPDFDFEAIKIPDSGALTYEFDIEVRPEFEMPTWKGLELKRYSDEVPAAVVEQYRAKYFGGDTVMVPVEDGVKAGDQVAATFTVSVDGKQVAKIEDQTVNVVDTLSFPEGDLTDFAKTVAGAKAGETREFTVKLSAELENADLADKEASVVVSILDVKRPEVVQAEDEEAAAPPENADDLIKSVVQRQISYHSNRFIRDQINELLTESANWELPPGLLKRQFRRELERAVLELRSSGFDQAQIKAYENTLRQNVMGRTRTLLQEHFILERIAEEEKIDAEEGDFEKEIFLIAMQSGESPRRIRAQIEKRGLMDVLQNQIVERKVLELVQSEAKFKDKPYAPEKLDSEAINMAAGGEGDEAIPVAKDEAKEETKAVAEEEA